MFQKLHRQMTIFCTSIVGAILIGLSLTCLFFARKAMLQTDYSSFQKELNTLLTSLQSQDYISHQWLRQMQNEHHFLIFLYDNGKPIFYESLQSEEKKAARRTLQEKALAAANIDIFYDSNKESMVHEEFSLKSVSQESYYVSIGYLTKDSGRLSFIILYNLSNRNDSLVSLYLFIFAADAVTLVILAFFSWHFTRRLLRPLEENQKRQQQFVAAASHELRSPLAVILSGIETMEKTSDQTERHHFSGLIRQEGLRMQHLISDMLLLANADAHGMSLHFTQVQPDDILLTVYEKYEQLAIQKKIFFQLSLPEDFFQSCCLDVERITQVLAILIDNALSYTPAGEKVILFLAQTGKHNILFGVANTGPCIPEKEKPLIFDCFYRSEQSHTNHEHFGLGLSVAKEIVKEHKGEIHVMNLQNCPVLPENANLEGFQNGTVFWLELPMNLMEGNVKL